MKKIVAFIILLFLVISIAGYFYLYQDHRKVSDTNAVKNLNANQLIEIFQDSDLENDKEILNQVVTVTGVITNSSANTLTIDNKIFIELEHPEDKSFTYVLNVNDSCTIKGRCLGYDDLLEEVKIDQAIIESKNPK